MRAHAFLDAAGSMLVATISDLLGDGGAIVVAPHPDDESLGCGALIASASAENRPVRIVIVSDGVGSHPNSRAFPPERLRKLRESETLAAAAALGIKASHVIFARLPDQHVPNGGREADRVAAVIVEQAREAGARAAFVTWRHDPHCDHQAAYAIARLAQRRAADLRLFEYSIWGRALPIGSETPEMPRGWRLEGASQRLRKQAAIACHRSQTTGLIDDDPDGFRLDPAHVARLVNEDEVFFEIDA